MRLCSIFSPLLGGLRFTKRRVWNKRASWSASLSFMGFCFCETRRTTPWISRRPHIAGLHVSRLSKLLYNQENGEAGPLVCPLTKDDGCLLRLAQSTLFALSNRFHRGFGRQTVEHGNPEMSIFGGIYNNNNNYVHNTTTKSWDTRLVQPQTHLIMPVPLLSGRICRWLSEWARKGRQRERRALGNMFSTMTGLFRVERLLSSLLVKHG
ncbi:uncharacterized protein B0H64DRAFT_65751 [Chaetomium fimeti]|uniref:Uncharacterized protein n=1 Tax=Chaetomium fimeti TaxID=1854472 RepID=A0AAE0HKA9_9PEZI|nr:hypothetical protein B0H64DRAFT_65751 [Chaetomium fimeti]